MGELRPGQSLCLRELASGEVDGDLSSVILYSHSCCGGSPGASSPLCLEGEGLVKYVLYHAI